MIGPYGLTFDGGNIVPPIAGNVPSGFYYIPDVISYGGLPEWIYDTFTLPSDLYLPPDIPYSQYNRLGLPPDIDRIRFPR